MDRIKRWRASLEAFCLDVVRWRSAGTFPYVMAVNFIFCLFAFYSTRESQFIGLYSLVGGILLFDLLFTSTHEHRVIYEIAVWPTRDLFKTSSVALSLLAIYELKAEECQEAFVSAAGAVCCLLIDPIYKYHKVNEHILHHLQRCLSGLKLMMVDWVVIPLMRLFEWAKYVALFQWMPVMLGYLHSWWLRIWQSMDSRLIQPLTHFLNRFVQFTTYWLCFHWVGDLRSWARTNIYTPLAERTRRVVDSLVYLFGCYWLVPAMRRLGVLAKSALYSTSLLCLEVLKQISIALGLYVFQPALAALLDQMLHLSIYLYRLAIQPAIDICYAQYKQVEDWVLIHVLGPLMQRVVDAVPEKNPFSEGSDVELTDFLPNHRQQRSMQIDSSDPLEGEEEDGGVESDATGISSNNSLPSDDQHHFLRRGLNRIDMGDSDSSDADFLPTLPSSRSSARRRKGTNRRQQ